MQIEKLRKYKTSDDGCYWYDKPTNDDIINKINEIVDYINAVENTCADTLKSIDAQSLLNCKYCGGEPKVRYVGDWKQYFVYFCSKCGKTPVHFDEARRSESAARNIWNKRTEEVK